jgi:hypothetical protein
MKPTFFSLTKAKNGLIEHHLNICGGCALNFAGAARKIERTIPLFIDFIIAPAPIEQT